MAERRKRQHPQGPAAQRREKRRRGAIDEDREPIYEPKQLPWAQHEAAVDKRQGWRRSYRVEKASFHKLVELLRPSLAVNAFFGALILQQ
ncbi:unnamed protein product [Ectocarpus sp. CCAP 1310/34]|nr:unnamed protein product [Ectocarpus sp. CCAP 1310/34]